MGDNDLMLSRHANSVLKCSGNSSHFMVMLQMGHTASSDLNLLAAEDRSSASSTLVFSNNSGLLAVTGGRGRNGLGNGKLELTKLFATDV